MTERTLDLRKAWEALSPDVQARLGMAAIAIGAAHLVEMIEEREFPAWQTAAAATHTNYFDAAMLEGVLCAAEVVHALVLDCDVARLLPPDLAALGIRQCTGCGCTDAVGCAEGCHWVGPLLCSSCAETGTGEVDVG
jgi:hypothetical protein